jgi:2-oxoglutarate dehydrogenase E2 component (dihydrolipoamide succinyltransferase)
MRKTISRRLVAVKNQTAMLTTFNEMDMTRIHRNSCTIQKIHLKNKNGIGLGFMSFFTKACAIALQKFPAINAYIDDENIIYHDFCRYFYRRFYAKRISRSGSKKYRKLCRLQKLKKIVKRLALLGRDGNLDLRRYGRRHLYHHEWWRIWFVNVSTPIINATAKCHFRNA